MRITKTTKKFMFAFEVKRFLAKDLYGLGLAIIAGSDHYYRGRKNNFVIEVTILVWDISFIVQRRAT